MDKKYSIILPVRNGMTYATDCVSSILSQEYDAFELIILDNCSTDGTVEWLQSLADPRIKLYPSDRPLSMEENWGRIRTVPKNEFMTIIGHDDILDKGYLTAMDRLIQDNPTYGLFQAHFRFIDNKGELINKCQPMPAQLSASEFLAAILRGTIDTMGTGYMMRSADYEKAGGIPAYPNLLFADHALWLNLSQPGGLAVAKEECFSFRVHQSTSRITNIVDYIRAFFLFLEFLNDLKGKSKELSIEIEKNAPGFIAFYSRSFSHRLIKTSLPKDRDISVRSLLDKSKWYADKLSPGNDFDPREKTDIRVSEMIDSNRFLSKVYMGLRSIYNKPFRSK